MRENGVAPTALMSNFQFTQPCRAGLRCVAPPALYATAFSGFVQSQFVWLIGLEGLTRANHIRWLKIGNCQVQRSAGGAKHCSPVRKHWEESTKKARAVGAAQALGVGHDISAARSAALPFAANSQERVIPRHAACIGICPSVNEQRKRDSSARNLPRNDDEKLFARTF